MESIPVPDEITRWLKARDVVDPRAVASLFEALYGDLKRRAHAVLRREPVGATLNTTGLVNEAFLRLSEAEGLQIHDRGHFLTLAARTMRWVVVDTARARKRQRRGGDVQRVSLEEALVMSERRADDLLAVDTALERLAELDQRLADVVELRYYGGLSVEEAATVLDVSSRTIKRDWRKARAFLAHELGRVGSGAPAP